VYLVSTEPVGTEDWMPLNDYPSAKPTYEFYDTVNRGQTAIGNGILLSRTVHPPGAEFPHGSVTWHWRSASPVASYLVQSSIGDYRLDEHTAADGIRYYAAQSSAISPGQRRRNQTMIVQLQNITDWESRFTGRYPFQTSGLVVGTASVDSGEEEMQTMISFNGGSMDLPTVYHEDLHQWWGDNVTESGYRMTFYKEGFGKLAEYLLIARRAQQNSAGAGGTQSIRGDEAFDRSLIEQFDSTYRQPPAFWRNAPSNPTPWTLFDDDATYIRPAAAYIALRQILGRVRFTDTLARIQHDYGGATITEPELEREFEAALPNQTVACRQRLQAFFAQWFDTGYAPRAHPDRPAITGPRLAGEDFFQSHGCKRP
jgi:aminopeptidase N